MTGSEPTSFTSIAEASESLSELVDRAARGVQIVIGRAGGAIAVLVAYERPKVSRELGGAWVGRVRIADDFDDLPDDVARAFGTSVRDGS